MLLYEELEWRGLIQNVSSLKLKKKINEEKLIFYIGTDPTADSLHLGHYSSFLLTKRLAKFGHKPIILLGQATGLIGDPRGTVERDLVEENKILENLQKIKKQINEKFGYEVVNNYDWIKNINLIDYLRNYGKYINLGYMLGKDLIRRQMKSGISYTEFSYMMVQALDFEYLNKNMGVTLQIAGSDQWGNATTGIELVRKKLGQELYVLTTPLILDFKGNKFGKSEGNAIWLEKDKTSSYELYQFLINVEDEIVIDYIKKLTFLEAEEIKKIEKEHLLNPKKKIAQNILAKEIVVDLHGFDEYTKAYEISKRLFENKYDSLSEDDFVMISRNKSYYCYDNDDVVSVLVKNKICKSNVQAKELINCGAISVNSKKIQLLNEKINKIDALYDRFIVIEKGKKNKYLFELK